MCLNATIKTDYLHVMCGFLKMGEIEFPFISFMAEGNLFESHRPSDFFVSFLQRQRQEPSDTDLHMSK